MEHHLRELDKCDNPDHSTSTLALISVLMAHIGWVCSMLASPPIDFPKPWRRSNQARRKLSLIQPSEMESNRYNVQNGSAISNGTSKAKTGGTRPRPPTVDEALPYSPFSSVVPFNSGLYSSYTIITNHGLLTTILTLRYYPNSHNWYSIFSFLICNVSGAWCFAARYRELEQRGYWESHFTKIAANTTRSKAASSAR